MNNDYSRAVKEIASRYTGIINSGRVFSQEEATRISREIDGEVMPLLNFEKPRVLVYGIYNSGKSTLVNALMGREVAEVADRPMTFKTAEYDAGKYVLVDSPGIDAPGKRGEDDDMTADSEIRNCHIILFVISSNGGFESRTNYKRMYDLMLKRNLPFIIVLNERAVPTSEQQQHQEELNSIKLKIIENLKEISGRRDIENAYEVITLNALRAWRGVSEAQTNPDKAQKFVKASHISDLVNRINQILEGDEAMKSFLAPLSALEDKIADGESILAAKSAGKSYATKRTTLQSMISNFRGRFMDDLRFSAERHFDEIYNGYLGGHIDMAGIYNSICSEAEDNYKRASAPIISYVRSNFAELHVSVDESGRVTLNTPNGYDSEFRASDEENHKTFSLGDILGSIVPTSGTSDSYTATTAGALLGGTLGSFVPILGTVAGTAIGGAIGKVIDIFIGKARREAEEYERRKREVEASNRMAEQRAEEENRRRQSARSAATNQINAIIQDLRRLYGEVIDKNFNGVMQTIDEAINRISTRNSAVEQTKAQLRQLHEEINAIRRSITC